MKYKFLLLFWVMYSLMVSAMLAQQNNRLIPQFPITKSFNNQHLLQIFDELEREYPVHFFFREEWIPRMPLNISFNNESLESVLDKLLESTNLGFVAYDTKTVIIASRIALLELDAFSFQEFVADVGSIGDQKQSRTERIKIVGDSTIRPLPTTITLKGRLLDLDTDQPLTGGQVRFPELQIGTFTDTTGQYSIEIPTGKHELEAEAPGHEKILMEIIVYSEERLDISLGYTAFQLDEVLLQAGSEGQSLESSQAGRIQLSMIDIKSTPSLMGEVDIINTILLLPGVNSTGESSSGFNVRGGNIDQNLILQDGQMLFNSSHLLGFFSVINPDIVQRVNLYKGHIPAQYGGRVSSVLDIDLIEGSNRKTRGTGNIGLFSSKLSINGPIQRDRSSFVVGLRAAYPNIITKNVDRIRDVKQSSSYYGDFTMKLTQKLGDLGKISVFGYASTDFFRFSDDFGFDWQTYSGGVSWQQIYGDNLSIKIEANASRYTSNFFNNDATVGSSNDTGVDNINYRANVQYVPTRKHDINFGISGTYYNILPNDLSPSSDDSFLRPLTAQKDQGLEAGIYVNDDFELNDFISFSAGLRISFFQNGGPFTVYEYQEGLDRNVDNIVDSMVVSGGKGIKTFVGFEPRISARILFDETTSIKLSYNRLNQYIHLLSNTASPTPIDIWQVSNTYFPAQIADNFSFGFFKDFNNRIWQTSVEVFYRKLDGLVVPKNFARLLANPHVETEVLNAEGKGYGVEVSIKRNFGALDLEASFAYTRSLRRTVNNLEDLTINGGEWFPSDFDSPYNVSLSARYKPSRTKTFGATFIYKTGRPISVPVGGFDVFPSWFIPVFTERNSFRIPDYHRLDLSYTFDDGLISRKKLTTEFTFSLYNVYARQNAYSIFFRKEGPKFKPYKLAILGTILPFISYNIKF